ncbi:SMI1/KNR4 family protein [Acinetobacter guillouiae]|uniref:SMI1/KNR4 family protein n=1 Tax=Acinetobacter guillouiae TaxID=106649 RepID=UPI0026E1A600|nr:SMI1/KNR4 family protein [Acinetobacter guillouiae]MDO6646479.1 SMI1/KNR4 family protein [Acinetobacter guillouiae]
MIEIDHKTDIIIPFNKIGDPEWDVKTRLILESLADLNDDEIAPAIDDEQILKLEQRLNCRLPESLTIFYQHFGIADIGEQLQQFDDIGYLKDIWANAPQYAPEFSQADLAVLPHLITFSDYLGNGNMFCFHDISKEIYYFDHDDTPYLSKILECVDDYIKGCLILVQSEFFAEAHPDEVDEWVEERFIALFNEQILKKWRY